MLRAAALLMVAVFGVSACNSEPSAQRVANDLINTLAETDEERDCMLGKVKAYSQDELEEIGEKPTTATWPRRPPRTRNSTSSRPNSNPARSRAPH